MSISRFGTLGLFRKVDLVGLITGGKFPAPWGVTVFLGDERIHTQEPQRDGVDVPLGIPREVQKSGV